MGSREQPMTLRRAGVIAVHSVQRFALRVPDLAEAARFYAAFGLDVREEGGHLDLRTFGNDHVWGGIYEGSAKKLEYVTYGIFAEDEPVFRERIDKLGVASEPPGNGERSGLWLRDPDGLRLQLVVADKVSPSQKSRPIVTADFVPGERAAPARSAAAHVRPRHLSHVLRFTPDVPRMVAFCRDVLGIRLSDHSADIIAFMHGAHGSDHHLVAFAKSELPGLHHTSWDVGSIDEVGRGSEQMRNAGYVEGWGVGRHAIGSNYFYYVRDPWGSWSEYSFDIDFIGADLDWRAADHPLEDSLYVWGPPPHPEFINNHEGRST
jgi:catechol 2,3-dioxygenase-like lactoylglutathione lyase family enzyme